MRIAGSTALALAILLPPAASAAPPPQPRLIVAISVDQLSADLFAQYRPLFTSGLKRLSEGAVFPSGYQSHAATETCPGHSTILTGARPSRSGIIANDWFDFGLKRTNKKLYCAEDPNIPARDGHTVSARNLKVPTLGDRLKAADKRSRVVSVAGKDRSAVMLGGHATDQLWYWGGTSYVTVENGAKPPAALAPINARATAAIANPPAATLPAACSSKVAAVPVAGTSVGELRPPAAGDARAFRATPTFDNLTADLATGLTQELKLGHGPAPDLLAIGLSATDYVGHGFGTAGPEMCANLLALDQTIGRILAALDANAAPYAVVLTADHGGHDLPERNRQRGIPDAVRVDPALMPATFGNSLRERFGGLDPSEPLIYGDAPFGDWYLSRAVPITLRPAVLAEARTRLLAHPQVAAVLTADELRALPAPATPPDEWTLAERARASFDPDRSGDLIVLLKPNVTPVADPSKGPVATHGSPWQYDRRVPILFWWPGMKGFEQPLPVETVDILPSLAPLLGLTLPPAEIDGRCRDLDPGEGTTCR